MFLQTDQVREVGKAKLSFKLIGKMHNIQLRGYCCHKCGSMAVHGLFLLFRQHASTPTWDEMKAQLAQYIPNTHVHIFIVEP